MLYDLIIIGSGYWTFISNLCTKAKLENIIIEKMPMSGGQVMSTEQSR